MIVGVTSAPEAGILPVTEPRRFGPTRNPWDTDRTPGGSSGGAAAAVAAGMVPVAHGSDGGGSIRIPAACCGLVGLKVTRGRISRGPDLGDHFLAVDGALTRTVAETAALLDVLEGYEPGDATWAPPPDEPFADQARRERSGLRVAMITEPPIDAEIAPGAAAGRARRRRADALARARGRGGRPAVVGRHRAGAVPGLLRGVRREHLAERGLRGHGRRPRAERGDRRAADARDLPPEPGAHVGRVPDGGGRATALRPRGGELHTGLRRAAHARTGRAARAHRRDRLDCGASRSRPSPAPGGSPPSRRSSTPPGSPPSPCRCSTARTDSRSGSTSSGRRPGEGLLLDLATQLESARPWADRRAPVVA